MRIAMENALIIMSITIKTKINKTYWSFSTKNIKKIKQLDKEAI